MDEVVPENTVPQQQLAQPEPTTKKRKRHLPEVLTVRDWKDYLGESMLIIFSVALALVVTEYFNGLHEKQQTKEVIEQLKAELTNNKKAEALQYAYQLQVLKNIDAALSNPLLAKKFIDSGAMHLETIAPAGIKYRDLNDVAWQVAKQHNIVAKIDLDTYSQLTYIYDNQHLINNAEQEIAKVLVSWESRKPENLRTTLLLLKDNYHGWAVDRAPGLLQSYQQATDKLEKY